MFGGLLGLNADDARLINSESTLADAGIKLDIKIHQIGAIHPNTYKLTLTNQFYEHQIVAVSTGGGMIEIIELDGIPISMKGDYFETIIYIKKDGQKIQDGLSIKLPVDPIFLREGNDFEIVEIKSQKFIDDSLKDELLKNVSVIDIKEINPVLPILTTNDTNVPFLNCEGMSKFNQDKNWPLCKLAKYYE